MTIITSDKVFDDTMNDMCRWFKAKRMCDVIPGKYATECQLCEAETMYECMLLNDEEFYSELSYRLAIENFECKYFTEDFIVKYAKASKYPMERIEALAYIQIYAHLVLTIIEWNKRHEGKNVLAPYGRSIKQQFIDHFRRLIEE